MKKEDDVLLGDVLLVFRNDGVVDIVIVYIGDACSVLVGGGTDVHIDFGGEWINFSRLLSEFLSALCILLSYLSIIGMFLLQGLCQELRFQLSGLRDALILSFGFNGCDV